MDGILIIDKPTGITSHDVVAKVRKLLKQKRVGHAGTLDPGASGVLPVCVGQATRVAEYLSESGKAYRATIVMGVVTDTYDAEGNVLRTGSVDDLTREQITAALSEFLGDTMQVPPRYSAIKIAGQPAYKRARAGEEITLEARPVTFYALDIIDWQPPVLILDIECSKGTYIRSLAYDLGERLGCGAHLHALVRTRSGPFTLDDCITLEELAQGARYMHPADSALQEYPALVLSEDMAERVRHGSTFAFSLPGEVTKNARLARVYDEERNFIAIAKWDETRSAWQPDKVFQ